MDSTLTQVLRALFEAHQTIDQLRMVNETLRAANAELAQKEAADAIPEAVL